MSLSSFQGTRTLIFANFKEVGFPISGIITKFYGPKKAADKRSFLRYLIKLRGSKPTDHWVVRGDFNLITSLEEKRAGDDVWRKNVIFLETLLKIWV